MLRPRRSSTVQLDLPFGRRGRAASMASRTAGAAPKARRRGRPPGSGDVPHPFLKWAGGKTQLLPQFEVLYPPAAKVRRYIEPFVGSGAVFFHVRKLLRPEEIVLADGNEELINVYKAVRDDVEGVIRRLARLKQGHSKQQYYRVRAQDPERLAPTARAARLIYLNKTCFNGLYRVNSRGLFNVPMGSYVNPSILDAENLRAASAALRNVVLKVAHFAGTLEYAEKGDFIYFDPPYQPISKTSFFTAYTDGAFDEEDQKELAEVYARLARRGCLVMLSNSHSPLVRRLYRRFDLRAVVARRSINSKGDRRGGIAEVVVINYAPGGARSAAGEARPRRANGSLLPL